VDHPAASAALAAEPDSEHAPLLLIVVSPIKRSPPLGGMDSCSYFFFVEWVIV